MCVTHFGLNQDEQELAHKTVLDHIPAKRCVLMGDMNVTPDHPILAGIRARMDDAAMQFPRELNSFPSDHREKRLITFFESRSASPAGRHFTDCSVGSPPASCNNNVEAT